MKRLTGFGVIQRPVQALFRASAIANASTITVPASAQKSDVAILFDTAFGIGTPTDVVPTDWTGVMTATGSTSRIRVSRKILVAADAGATVTGMNDSSEDKVMLVFRVGFMPVRSVAVGTWNGEVTDGNPSQQTVTTVPGVSVPLIVFGAASSAGSTAFSVASPAFDGTVITADDDLLVGYKIYNGNLANHSIDMVDLGSSNILASGYMSFS